MRGRLFPKATPPDYIRAFKDLRKGDIAIDCGANVGMFTAVMAWSGARVFAFEPNPFAFSVLKKNLGRYPNVELINKAVSNRSGQIELYLHQNAEEDQVKWSQGGSVIAQKENVDSSKSLNVDVVDFCEYLRGLQSRVRLIKMDIEGAEVGLLQRFLKEEAYKIVDTMFVETHERKIPSLREPMGEIKREIQRRGIENIHLDWV